MGTHFQHMFARVGDLSIENVDVLLEDRHDFTKRSDVKELVDWGE